MKNPAPNLLSCLLLGLGFCINAPLATAGSITGKITGPDGVTPLAGIQVSASVWIGDGYLPWYSDSYTQSDGAYTLADLAAGTYRVRFQDWSGNHIAKYFDNAPTLDTATDIVVGEAATVGGINASLAVASRITGTVTGPDGVAPLAGIQVRTYVWDDYYEYWASVGSRNTQSNGTYTLVGLAAGTYRVRFWDWSGNHIAEYFDSATTLETATDIVVGEAATVGGINASLAAASHITGTVTGPDGVTPLQGIDARAYVWNDYEEGWDRAGTTSTASDGSYTIGGLSAGTFRVWFYDWNGGYLPEYYLDSQSIDAAADIVVAAATTVTAIDASLAAITRPPNDDFANRVSLESASGIEISGSLGGGTSEYASGEPDLSEWDIAGEGQSWDDDDLTVWYEWTAPAGAQWARVELTDMNLPSVLSVYTGSALSNLNQVGINQRTIVQLANRLTFPVTPGTTYQIRPAVTADDYFYYYWQSDTPPPPLDPDFVLKVSTIGSPVTADEFVLRGRGFLESRKSTDLALAEADFSAALAIDASHDEARFLRALTRLLLVEVEPAADTLLGQLGASRSDSFRNAGDITMPKDFEGDSIPGVGSRTGMAIDWIDNAFLPRLAEIRTGFRCRGPRCPFVGRPVARWRSQLSRNPRESLAPDLHPSDAPRLAAANQG